MSTHIRCRWCGDMVIPEMDNWGHLWCEICNRDLGEAPDQPTEDDWAEEKRAHARDLALFEG